MSYRKGAHQDIFQRDIRFAKTFTKLFSSDTNTQTQMVQP